MSCIAVIDVETTGLNPYRHDRIVEIAATVMLVDGTILREFSSVINPERDIGPTRIHGFNASDVACAPRFGEMAGALVQVLDGCVVLAGHNFRFDHSFLVAEFERLGYTFPDGPTLCTMELAGRGSLVSCCLASGITLSGGPHMALHDARSTAQLLAKLLSGCPKKREDLAKLPQIVWPIIPKSSVLPVTRDESRSLQAKPPAYLERLLARVQGVFPPNKDDSDVAAYTNLLDRILEDRRVDEAEGEALLEVAARWNIDGNRIQKIHHSYLYNLARAALADGTVTDVERRDLSQVAHLIGIEQRYLDEMLDQHNQEPSEPLTVSPLKRPSLGSEQLIGKRVCFTGEFQCQHSGVIITREMATDLVTRKGIIVVEAVTKKLDFLVVADPQTDSGKAKKARQYGIRILHEPVFWKALEVEVQ